MGRTPKQADANKHRKQAADRMKRQKAGTEKLPPEDLRTMVQELHTSKKELEIRNEKLRRARKEADAERTWYAELYENARSAISPMTPTAS